MGAFFISQNSMTNGKKQINHLDLGYLPKLARLGSIKTNQVGHHKVSQEVLPMFKPTFRPMFVPTTAQNQILAHIAQHVELQLHQVATCSLEPHRCQARDVINAHAVMGVQHRDLAAGADAQPVCNVLCCAEGEGVQDEQGQGKVIHKVARLGQLDVGLILLVHLTQQPALTHR